MKAAVLNTPQNVATRPLRIVEAPQPLPGPASVLLRVKACGVYRTDLHIVEGELFQRRKNVIPGHQIVGEVVDGATDDLPIGARVGVCWMVASTGHAGTAKTNWKTSATSLLLPDTRWTAGTSNMP